MEKKLVKLAVFVSGFVHGCVPPGCPKEFSDRDLKSRMALADWFLKNGKPYYLGEKDGAVFYSYKNFFDLDVAVVEIDISRPWMFHINDEDGGEHIYTVKSRSEFNEVEFDCHPFPLKPRIYLGLEKV